MFIKTFLLFLSTLIINWSLSGQFDLNITAYQDNTIYQDDVNGSNGIGEYLLVGKTSVSDGSQLRRALIQFDLSLIPSNSIITSAEIRIQGYSGGPSYVNMHRVLTSWGEGDSKAPLTELFAAPADPPDATWTQSQFGTAPWIAAGGDYDPTVSASAIAKAGTRSDFTSR